MKVLVTGSSGQLGSYVCERMYDSHDVLGFDMMLARVEGMESILGDVRRRDDVREAVRGVDVVIHCAAQVSVERSMEDPVLDATTNVMGTVYMLHEAALSGTAACLAPVGTLVYRGEELAVRDGQPGPNTARLRDALQSIQYGDAPDTHGWLTECPPA